MDVFGCACPNCDKQPNQECEWGDAPSHPRFHAERIQAASMVYGIQQGLADNTAKPELLDQAIESVVDQMF